MKRYGYVTHDHVRDRNGVSIPVRQFHTALTGPVGNLNGARAVARRQRQAARLAS